MKNGVSGIYAITCTANKVVYVGSSNNIRNRWAQHRQMLVRNIHYNKRMQHSWNKYGEGSFDFAILENVPDAATLMEREQYWLDTKRADGDVFNYGLVSYNAFRGMKQTKEHSENIRNALKGKPSHWMGKNHKQESKEKLSRSLKEYNKTHAHNWIGKKHSQAWKDNMAKPYPSIINVFTGEIIPAGKNKAKLCSDRKFSMTSYLMLISGSLKQYKGWRLYDGSTRNLLLF